MNREEEKFRRNLLIVANAGSGKTHRLVTRCIQLLQRGAKPEQILALTFTRAAAAEFLQKLFERLSKAATDRGKLDELRRELADCPAIDAEGCVKLLRKLVDAMPRLSMGTLDQYFGRIVRAFPLELGLAREVELLDDADKEENRRRALEELFAREAGAGLREFIELLRQQSRNRADQSALRVLSNSASLLQETFIETPQDRKWGDPGAIWPGGSKILAAGDVAAVAGAFAVEVAATNPQLDAGARATLDEWLALAAAHRAPRRMNDELVKFVKKLGDGGLGKGRKDEPYIPIGRGGDAKCIFLRGRVRALRDDLRHAILKGELEGKLRASRALYDLLERYENIYHHSVRRAGYLTFADLVMLLADNQKNLSHRHIEYRLDARYDHWLLDEFQDTSRLQWRVMEPLAEEIVWDPEERRSFFYVGDAKQAIYGWRGGDFELFGQVRDKFNENAEHIFEERLSVSRRSDKKIVEVIDRVFAPARLEDPANSDFNLPAKTVEDWRNAWVPHVAVDGAKDGLVEFRALAPVEIDGDDDGQMALDRAVLDILAKVDPVGRGINCAIIVRTREMLDHYVALLRGQENPIPAAAQGRVNPCLRTPEGLTLFSLAKFLASPSDRIAGEHFLASPFGFLARENPGGFRLAALGSVFSSGFAATFGGWVRAAAGRGLVDPEKAAAFIEAAADYDAQRKAGDDLRRFVEFIDLRVQQETETPGVVRVMTIHFAKGLGMDMVILPELGGKGIAEFRDTSGIAVHRDRRGAIQWGMDLPSKDICASDETLWEAREDMRAKQTYENLCLLYVAMTRAKHALYCLRVKGKDTKNPGRWLEQNLPPAGEGDPDIRIFGDELWFESFHRRELAGPEIRGDDIRQTKPRPHAALPSSHEGEDIPAGVILGGGEARHLGTEVHAMLARIEWLGDQPDCGGAGSHAVQLVRDFLASERAAFLARPGGHVHLWRERAFDVEIDGKPLSGVFDRVHIVRGAGGKPVSAHIYDYKTDKNPGDLREKYGEQLDAYRKAAAQLLGLDPADVEATPVAVRAC